LEPSQTGNRAACTIIARNYLAQARVLANSYLEHERDGRFFILVVDGIPEGVQLGPSITVLRLTDIGIPDLLEMAFQYDITELCTAVKPWLMSHIMHAFAVDQVIYFDPDIAIFRPLDEMWALLDDSHIVLIPHLLDPIPLDGNRPSEQDILIAGAYNLGFVGLRTSADTTRMLDWWKERLRDLCRIDVPHGLFVDQKWIDLVPSLFRGTAILRDDTYDVAYWNLHSRSLEQDGDTFLINGRPLAFFHYSGFDPLQPRVLSKHQNRLLVDHGTPLAALLDNYAQAVQRLGFALTRGWPYGYGRFDNRSPISGLHRRLYASLDADQRHELGDPFLASSPSSFFQWAGRPPSTPDGLNRFLEYMLSESLEARTAFPDARGRQQKAFLMWAQTHGVERFGYDPRLADPSAWPSLTVNQSLVTTNGTAGAADGVNILGYLTNETGIGAVARGFARALRGMGVPLGLRDLAQLSPNRSQDTTLDRIDDATPYGINVVCVNADQHFVVKAHVGDHLFKDHYNIGVWFWELPTFPEAWADRFQEYDEIWAPSSFIANTLAAISPIPIVRVPPVLATTRPGSREAGRDHLGVGPNTFVFLFVFDFASYFRRKNPLATIQAFRNAFAPDDDVRLVIKCVNEHLDPDAFASLQTLADQHPVSIHTGYWTNEEMRDLTAACEASVSLHRSEGLGLTMADAMAHGKPVIATAWSGNTDFMNASNSFPVPYQLVELTENAGPYRAGSVWAEPDMDEAVRLMRLVHDDRTLGQTRGQVARDDLEEGYSEQAVGEVLQQRLALAVTRQKQRAAAKTSSGFAEAHAPAPRAVPIVPPMDLGDSSHGRLGVLMKRGMNFLLRYHTHYQGEINLAFAAFLRQLSAEQDAQAAEIKTLEPRGEVKALEAQLKDVIKLLSKATTELARHETYFSARPYMAVDAFGTTGDLNKPMGYSVADLPPDRRAALPDFSDVFRGQEDFVADRQRTYLRFFKGVSNVVDLGAGRGEFLELMREQGIDAVGVELDPVMVERCLKRGLRAVHADAYDFLQELPERSVDVIFSAQFVEHVPSQRLLELLELARSRLREGGLFIAETVNPESHLAAKTFFVDLTHQRLIFPQVLLQIGQEAGYESARIFYPTAGGFTQAQYRDAGEYAIVAVK
jgi:glycosyltransferase involved in cell wall biosynthesis/phospholipid N-methyltransferase